VARGFNVRANVRSTYNPNADKEVSRTRAFRSGLEETLQAAERMYQITATNSAVRRMISSSIDYDSRGRVVGRVGSSSSFAHWEEFGQINWHGPTGALRRALSLLNLKYRTIGANSQTGRI
jgi:hypothetical protein